MSDIVQKLWGFCHTLRHDGVDYGDYIEQLTYLLFLKMADERDVTVPKNCDWDSLKAWSGTDLTDHYADILRKLREGGGLLGDIFAQTKAQVDKLTPSLLARAFRGHLVSQDPADEPAEKLLERLHAQSKSKSQRDASTKDENHEPTFRHARHLPD